MHLTLFGLFVGYKPCFCLVFHGAFVSDGVSLLTTSRGPSSCPVFGGKKEAGECRA